MHRPGGRLSGVAAARRRERLGEAPAQPLERELAIAGLAAGVLGDRGHARARARDDPALLLVGQRRGRLDIEDRLDPGRRDVRVLAAGTG